MANCRGRHPKQKEVISLTYIYGIGRSRAKEILGKQKLTKILKFLIGQMNKLEIFVLLSVVTLLKVN